MPTFVATARGSMRSVRVEKPMEHAGSAGAPDARIVRGGVENADKSRDALRDGRRVQQRKTESNEPPRATGNRVGASRELVGVRSPVSRAERPPALALGAVSLRESRGFGLRDA